MIDLVEWVDELSGLVPDILLPEQLAEASFELTQARYIGYFDSSALLATNYYISDIHRLDNGNYIFCWIPSPTVD